MVTRIQQTQISGTVGPLDNVGLADLEKAGRTLEDDLNSLRSQVKRIQGTTNWTDALEGEQSLSVIFGAMDVVDTTDVQFQGDMIVTGTLQVTGAVNFDDTLRVEGDLTVASNYVYGADGLNLSLMSGGEVKVEGDLIVGNNNIKSWDGTTAVTAISLLEDDVTVAGEMTVNGGKITLTHGSTIDSLGEGVLLLTEDLVEVSGDLQVTGNDIKSGTGDVAITLSGPDVRSNGVVIVGGNQIHSWDSGSSTDTVAITLSGDDVEVEGVLQVTGNDIKSGAGEVAISLSGVDVQVSGSLTVKGNTIDSSTDTVMTFDGENVSMPGNLTVQGDLVIQGQTTVVETENLLVKDAIVGFGFTSGEGKEADGDRGFIFALADDNSTMFWDENLNEFRFAFTSHAPNTAGPISASSDANLRAGSIVATGGLSGSLTKLADGSTDYLQAGVGVSIAVNVDGSITISSASDSYAKDYFDMTDVVGGVLDFGSLGTLSEVAHKNIDVFLNGVLLRSGEDKDVELTSSTTITLNAAIVSELQPEDVITVVVRALSAV